MPTATTLEGISLTTILPAPITVLFPILTPGNITTLPPSQTLFPISIGFAYSNPLLRCSTFIGCPDVYIPQFGPINTLSPIFTLFASKIIRLWLE